MCGIRVAFQGKVEAVDEGLNFAIAERPAKIDGTGGADEVGGKIVLTVRIDGAGSSQQQCAGLQRAAADFDAALL